MPDRVAPRGWNHWRVAILIAAAALLAGASLFWAVPIVYSAGGILALLALTAFFAPPEAARPPPGASPAQQAGTASLDPLLEALPDPALLVDGEGIVRSANAHARAQFPATRRGGLFVSTFRAPELKEALGEAQAGRARSIGYHGPGEANREYLIFFAPLGVPGRGDRSVVVVIRDVSDRVAIARMRADFVANASHELRTPLASLTGFIETLLGPARSDPEAAARFLRIMLEQAHRMRRLIDDLLSLSRVEMRSNQRPRDRVDLRDVLRHVSDALAPMARDYRVQIHVGVSDAALDVLGDRDELVQVFQNLIENAIRYGASGGRVEVATLKRDEAPERVAIEVRDFGPGIAEEHLPRLTERFYRVDVGASRDMKGTGLGLAIVKHILVRHDGRLEIRSRPGEGARFIVDLPRAPQAESAAPTAV